MSAIALVKVNGTWSESDADALSRAWRSGDGAASVSLSECSRLYVLYEVTAAGPCDEGVPENPDDEDSQLRFSRLKIRQGLFVNSEDARDVREDDHVDTEVALLRSIRGGVAVAYRAAVAEGGLILVEATDDLGIDEDDRTRSYDGGRGSAPIGLAKVRVGETDDGRK